MDGSVKAETEASRAVRRAREEGRAEGMRALAEEGDRARSATVLCRALADLLACASQDLAFAPRAAQVLGGQSRELRDLAERYREAGTSELPPMTWEETLDQTLSVMDPDGKNVELRDLIEKLRTEES